MFKIKSSLVVLLCIFSLHADIVPYVSPGISLAWNFKKAAIIGWKVSVGYMDEYGDASRSYFINITLGKKADTDHDFSSYNYWFTEIESGILTGALFSGAGIGTAFLRDENNKLSIAPKGSLYTGCGVFLRSDFVLSKKNMLFDIGGSVVLPFSRFLFDPPAVGSPFTT